MTLKEANFNPRPREEGDLLNLHKKVFPMDFNPRPREEGDSRFIVFIILCLCISIHALVKRATAVNRCRC